MQADDADYERLIRPIEDQMMRSVWRITQNADDAEEALQEALALIWRRFGRVCRHANPQALILRICMNSAYDVLRRKARRERWEQDTRVTLTEPSRTPSELAEAREQESAILRAIGQLSRNQALAVTLRLVQEQSYEAIARVLGCRENTVRKHVERGRARLCEMLAPMVSQLNKEGAR